MAAELLAGLGRRRRNHKRHGGLTVVIVAMAAAGTAGALRQHETAPAISAPTPAVKDGPSPIQGSAGRIDAPVSAPVTRPTTADAGRLVSATRPPAAPPAVGPTRTTTKGSSTPTSLVPTPTSLVPPARLLAPTWPGRTDTGVPAGVALQKRGALLADVPGAVYDGLDISGAVMVTANDITISRSRIRDGSSFYVVAVAEGVTGTVLRDCEINGFGAGAGTTGVVGSVTIERCNIHGVENGVIPRSGSIIRDSWIHGLSASGVPHYDGVQMDGDQINVQIRHNTIEVPEQTAAVMVNNFFGPIRNVVVDGNRLTGGTYAVYSDGQFGGGSIEGVSVINNWFGKSQYGYITVNNNTLAASHGNVDEVTGRPIDHLD